MDSNLKKMYTVNTFTFEIDVAAAISQFGLNGLWMSPVGWPLYLLETLGVDGVDGLAIKGVPSWHGVDGVRVRG